MLAISTWCYIDITFWLSIVIYDFPVLSCKVITICYNRSEGPAQVFLLTLTWLAARFGDADRSEWRDVNLSYDNMCHFDNLKVLVTTIRALIFYLILDFVKIVSFKITKFFFIDIVQIGP